MKLFHKYLVICLIFLLSSLFFCAYAFEPDISQDENILKESTNSDIYSTFLIKLKNATIQYENLNIQVSYENFESMINFYKNDNFCLTKLAKKTAEIGFFDLSKKCLTALKDDEIYDTLKKEISEFYFPQNELTKENIIILAELNSNILYNDRIKESITELEMYPRLLMESDYANYILALGYYKMNNIELAKKYICKSITMNPTNINYMILESRIFSNEKKGKISKKILRNISKKNIYSISLANKISSNFEYVSYLMSKKTNDKDYHLGKYYMLNDDYVKSIRVLQSATNSKNKRCKARNCSLISNCYLNQQNSEKAKEYAQKACKIKTKSSEALIVLGDIEFKNANYKKALNYYKDASKINSAERVAMEKIADTYLKLSYNNKSENLYKKILKKYKNSYYSCYKLGLFDDINSIYYIKKSLSMNLQYQDAWIDLARIMIEKNDYDMAKQYLLIAKYLDDNNFRYYYYQSLLSKKINGIKKL